MIRVNFIAADGTRTAVEANEGDTVMQAAVDNMVDGIVAECGGTCSCATCHCYVDEQWFDGIDRASEVEEDMMSILSGRRKTSRLSCQVELTPELDGIVIELPETQG